MNIFIPVLMSAFDIWKDNARQKQKKKKDHDFYSHNQLLSHRCGFLPIAESRIRKVYERSIFVNAILSLTRGASSVEIIGN